MSECWRGIFSVVMEVDGVVAQVQTSTHGNPIDRGAG